MEKKHLCHCDKWKDVHILQSNVRSLYSIVSIYIYIYAAEFNFIPHWALLCTDKGCHFAHEEFYENEKKRTVR